MSLKRICFLLLLLVSITHSVIYAEGIYTFIGKHPQLWQRTSATIFYVSEYIFHSESKTIFLKSGDVTIKVSMSGYIDPQIGDEIWGDFNKTGIQNLYNSRTKENFEGEVLCKRMLTSALPNTYENNTYVSGSNNTYSDNETTKGNNNVSRNNVYIGGRNNTVTGNTHHQGSNNVYEDNIIIGGSNGTRTDTETYGSSNRVVKGQVIDRSGSDSSINSYSSDQSTDNANITSSTPSNEEDFKEDFFVVMALIGVYCLLAFLCKCDKWDYGCIIFFFLGIFLFAKFSSFLIPVLIGLVILFIGFIIIKKNVVEDIANTPQDNTAAPPPLLPQTESPPTPIKQEPSPEYCYVGNKDTHIYHKLNCEYAKTMSENRKVYFRSQKEARKAGYRHCYVCKYQ